VTLASLVVCLTLFAYACGLTVGVAVGQAWYENRAGEFAEQALWDDEQSVQ
jgi:hypothetical protein